MTNVLEKFNQQNGQFSAIKEVYCRNEMNFELFYSGNIIKVQFEDGKVKRYGQFKKKEGMFLAKLTNKVVKQRIESGQYVPKNKDPSRLPFISLETRWASRMKIKLGDKLTFDIQGVEFEGIVRNLRDVKWTTFKPNFFVSIESGYIDLAPKTFLAILNEKKQLKKRKKKQKPKQKIKICTQTT